MDISPHTISAQELLKGKDVPSEIKFSVPGQATISAHKEKLEFLDTQDNDSFYKEMGKATGANLNHKLFIKSSETAMTPMKTWSLDFMGQSLLGSIANPTEHFSFDELVRRIQSRELDVELQKLIDSSNEKDLMEKQTNAPIRSYTPRSMNRDNVDSPNMGVDSPCGVDFICCNIAEVESGLRNSDSIMSWESNREGQVTEEDSHRMHQYDSNGNCFREAIDSSDKKLSSEKGYIVVHDHSYAYCGVHEQPVIYDVGDHPEDTESCSCHLQLGNNNIEFGNIRQSSASSPDPEGVLNSECTFHSLPFSASQSSTGLVSKLPFVGKDGSLPSGKIFTSLTPSYSSAASETKDLNFRIGSFASFPSANFGLKKCLKCQNHPHKKVKAQVSVESEIHSPTSNSPSAQSNDIYQLLHSPNLDWDRSEADSEAHDDSYDITSSGRISPYLTRDSAALLYSLYHDHDYCAKTRLSTKVVEDIARLVSGRRGKSTKRKYKSDKMSHEKILKKAKYLKEELLRTRSPVKLISAYEPKLTEPILDSSSVGKARKRYCSKIIDEDIDLETGSKLKITGQFKDQYVYYLSKSSRTTTRRREIQTPSCASDRIFVPAPTPGDIIVPHLTDADIETVRMNGRKALNIPERPHIAHPQSSEPNKTCSNHSNEFISDVDSHIVSTILSMESDSLASQSMLQAGESSNSGLPHSNQQTLAENLKLVSGDSVTTSEHVLNYLLSMMKDDAMLYNGPAGDSGLPAWLSSLQPDNNSTNITEPERPGSENVSQALSMTVTSTSPNFSPGQDLLKFEQPIHRTENVSQEQSTSSTNYEPEQTMHHAQGEGLMFSSANLPDDFTSFIPTSKEPSDGDSSSSVKNTFESNLSSLGTPQMPTSDLDLTSREKTLDYLCIKDVDNSLFNTKLEQIPDSTQVLTPLSSISSDDTPWIVTVTLYFNDVPAIMMNSEPYIRLVDIHKQILPAKDTGILKKRCQLLNIPVLTCSDMQRYFLVQYGRAYNSKSALVISKANATNLVSYYANPQPRMGRNHEMSFCGSKKSELSLETESCVAFVSSKKHERERFQKSGLSHSDAARKSLTKNNSAERCEVLADSHRKQTRHRRINYLDMLKGEERSVVSATVKPVVRSTPPCINEDTKKKMSIKKLMSNLISGNKSKVVKRKMISVHRNEINGREQKRFQTLTDIKTSRRGSGKKDKSVAAGSMDYPDSISVLSQSKRSKPLKVRVNSLLSFAMQLKHCLTTGRRARGQFSSSSAKTLKQSQRILAVEHESVLLSGGGKSSLPAQPGDIHLDLFFKPDSACVCCKTCGRVMSVPDIMQHHHVPIGCDWQTLEAAHHILVPMNKESLSQQERQLWLEFHQRQEAIGGFGEVDLEIDGDDDGDENSHNNEYTLAQSHVDEVGHTFLKANKVSIPVLNKEVSHQFSEIHEQESAELEAVAVCHDSPSLPDESKYFTNHGADGPLLISNIPSVEKWKVSSGLYTKSERKWQYADSSDCTSPDTHHSTSNLRTSSRKRKSKQLFSIENYYTPSKWVVGDGTGSQKPVRT